MAESLWDEAALPALAIVAAGLISLALSMRWISREGRGAAPQEDRWQQAS